jgi:FAD-dependent halogenase
MVSRDYDVIVIGGGPAGSCSAAHLARQGLRVLIIEGKQFPREHIGESLLAMSMPFLKDLGVEPKIEAMGFLRKSGSLFIWGHSENEIELAMPYPGYAFQVSRAHFDQLLLEHAQEQKVQVMQNIWTKKLIIDITDRVCGVVIEEKNGRLQEISCHYVIDASGLAQFLPRQLKLPIHLDGPKRVAISAYFQGAQRPLTPHENDIISEACRDGWLWFIPLSKDITSVGFVSDEYVLSSHPGRVLEQQIATSKLTKQLLQSATLARKARVLHYTNHIVATSLWGDGYVLVGDSAAFIDPLFSTGVHGALYSASLAAASLAAVHKGDLSETDAKRWYDWKLRKHYSRVNETVKLLYGIHSGTGKFWRDRALSNLSEEEAEYRVQRLGAAGMRFFCEVVRKGSLELPDILTKKIPEFSSQLVSTSAARSQCVCLAPGVELTQDWIYFKGRLIRGIRLYHTRNRTFDVELPLNSFRASLLQALDGRHCLEEIVKMVPGGNNIISSKKEEAKAYLFIGTLIQIGLLCQIG